MIFKNGIVYLDMSYAQVDTIPEILMDNGQILEPIASLKDEYGGICHIIIDDHCYVLVVEDENGFAKKSTHIFFEAFNVLRQLPPPF